MTRPQIIDAALADYKVYGRRGLDWIWDRSSDNERNAVDAWLLQVNHPSVFEPGTKEWRYKNYIVELTPAPGRQSK